MAQTANNRSAPFPPPPGLEAALAGQNGHAEPKVSAGASCSEIIETLRHTLSQDIDVKVNEKMEELWQKGRQIMSQAQLQHAQHTEKIHAELSMCLERQRTMEQQNEQIKQVIADLASKFTVIGSGFALSPSSSPPGCLKSPGSVATTAGGSSNSPLSVRASPTFCTNPLDSLGPLPEVPVFPFPMPAPAQLSLAEAIGAEPHHKGLPLSLANSLPPAMELTSTAAAFIPSAGVFNFTLRKADSTELGLNVSSQGAVLFVEGIRPEGAIDAWNRQCVASCPERAVMRGDRILSVNNVSGDPEKMLAECKNRQLLKFSVARGSCSPEATTPSTGRSLTLRADASEFIPTGAAPPGFPPA